jgi:hypothetical protein
MVLRKKKEGETGGKILRKKKKPEEEEDGATAKGMKKKKKNVAEIDGVLYALDENGNPTKKLRKKKKPGEEDDDEAGPAKKKGLRRAKSETAIDESKRPRGRASITPGQKIRRRGKSLGKDQAENAHVRPRRSKSAPGKARTYIDPKGRKVVIDDGGNKSVFDKNGKRLRKKGDKEKEAPAKEKPKPPAPAPQPEDDGMADDFLSGLNDDAKRESNMFDSLWDDRENTPKGNGLLHDFDIGGGNDNDGAQRETEVNNSLSFKISEVGKENKELQLQLSVAEEAIENLTEQNKKEKSKNVKAMTEVMALKADFTEASSELQKLRSKIADMQQTLEQKDRDIEGLGGAGGGYGEEKKNDGPCEACKPLKKDNIVLQETIDAEKATFEKELKKKDERINFLSIELGTIKEELEAMINGDKGGPSNPTMIRLLQEKKSLQTKYNQEKEVTTIRIEGMQEMMESLEMVNADLKKQLTSGGGGGGDNDDASQDGSLDMNYLIGAGDSGKKQRPGPRKNTAAVAAKPDLNASISDMFSGLMSRK